MEDNAGQVGRIRPGAIGSVGGQDDSSQANPELHHDRWQRTLNRTMLSYVRFM